MLVVYRIATGEVIFTSSTNSTFRTTLPIEFENNVQPYFGGELDDYGGIWIEDDGDEAQRILSIAGFCEVVNEQLVIYDRLIVSQLVPVAVDALVEIVAFVPADSPDTEVAFELDGVTVAEVVAAGVASHLYQFADPGAYPVTVSSAHHGRTTVEVVVQ
jgi:hypothetical protein